MDLGNDFGMVNKVFYVSADVTWRETCRILDDNVKRALLIFPKKEITEHIVYKRLAEKADGKNADVLKRISHDELRHYNEWRRFTLEDVPPNRLIILKIPIISKILGLTFAIKMMEGGERKAEVAYGEIMKSILHVEV